VSEILMDPKKETIKLEGSDFRWMCASLLASVDVTEFITTTACSSLDLIWVKYNMNILVDSRNENVKATLRTRTTNLIQREYIADINNGTED
jgi:hypothetical protein